ncbi:uncharacterized protein LOC120352966 [Nilaparvata lugens]|uniref:uncharacterized protein LOC120352966 n=1 Tax=Nilaparvata lugens TaxID=108931 RepID=UPI00193CA0D3|nr:uncharacterized protein LOC120352966 [Nilaparvata lugens]
MTIYHPASSRGGAHQRTQGMRGGVSFISKRYCKANNKHIPDTYDSTKPKTANCDNVQLEDFLTTASFEQIKLVVEKYNGHSDSSGKHLAEKINNFCPIGLMQEVYKRIVRYAAKPYEYLAKAFNLGIKENSFNTNAHR